MSSKTFFFCSGSASRFIPSARPPASTQLGIRESSDVDDAGYAYWSIVTVRPRSRAAVTSPIVVGVLPHRFLLEILKCEISTGMFACSPMLIASVIAATTRASSLRMWLA